MVKYETGEWIRKGNEKGRDETQVVPNHPKVFWSGWDVTATGSDIATMSDDDDDDSRCR